MTAPHINQLREHLLATLADLRNRENPMEPDRARAVAQVASVLVELVDTAKVEVDYLKATGQQRAGFLEEPPTPGLEGIGSDYQREHLPAPGNGITSITRHRIKG